MKSLRFAVASLVALAALVVSGCSLVGVNTGDGATATGAGGGTGTGTGVASGTSCGVDPSTGVTLCLGISTCASVAIDTEVFPACGFRISGNVLDVECVCGGLLCPLGAASTCDALATLLAAANEGSVCAQSSGGSCTEIAVTTTTTTTTTTGGSSTCDTTCRDECANDPTCILACGC